MNKLLFSVFAVLLLSGCLFKGGHYKNDGPPEMDRSALSKVADAAPKAEPLNSAANRPYTALGRSYTPMTSLKPFTQKGRASWYGRRYHGLKTSTGDIYDANAMTAAHPTLPLPCYIRVTNVENRRSVVVRVNDRGPFVGDRIVDVSYAAAVKLGFDKQGSAVVELELLNANDPQQPVVSHPIVNVASPIPTEIPQEAEDGKIYLQLGAFGREDNAQAFKQRMAQDLPWAASRLRIVSKGGLNRLQLGPYSLREEALKDSRRIQDVLGHEPLVVSP